MYEISNYSIETCVRDNFEDNAAAILKETEE